jgi:ClpP class serine protease
MEGPCWRDESGRIGAWHPQVQVIGSLAILPVKGMLGKHLSTLEMWCGGSDYAVIAAQARNIAMDGRIENVILHIDSPGGNCVGNKECAQAILELSQNKSTVAYTDKLCASAAYFLASACDEIIAAPSAIVGSISTYSAFLDESRAYEMEGLEVRMFRSGEVKGAGYPGKPWTPQEIAAMQLVTDQFSMQFKSFVKRQRTLSDEVMQGAYWPAEFAPANVVDDIENDLETLIFQLQSKAVI